MSNQVMQMLGTGRTFSAAEWQEKADHYLQQALWVETEYAGLQCCAPLIKLQLIDAEICEANARITRKLELIHH